MKANAPEKLYIALNELTEDERTFVLDHRVDYPICTEYTRTDAFIEKAEEYIYKQLNEGCIECGDIKRFVENMKIYIKGE